MNDQTDAALAAMDVTEHVNQLLDTLSNAVRFLRAMRVLWLEDESRRRADEARELSWRDSDYIRKARERSDEKMKAAF